MLKCPVLVDSSWNWISSKQKRITIIVHEKIKLLYFIYGILKSLQSEHTISAKFSTPPSFLYFNTIEISSLLPILCVKRMQKIKIVFFQFSFSNNCLPSKWISFYHCFFFVGSSLLGIIHFMDNLFLFEVKLFALIQSLIIPSNICLKYSMHLMHRNWFDSHTNFPTKYRILKIIRQNHVFRFAMQCNASTSIQKKIRSKIALVRSTSVLPSTLKDHKVNQ